MNNAKYRYIKEQQIIPLNQKDTKNLIYEKIQQDTADDLHLKEEERKNQIQKYKKIVCEVFSKGRFSSSWDEMKFNVLYKSIYEINGSAKKKLSKILSGGKKDSSPGRKSLQYLYDFFGAKGINSPKNIKRIEEIFLDGGIINFFIPYGFRYGSDDLDIKDNDKEASALTKIEEILNEFKSRGLKFNLRIMYADDYVRLNGISEEKLEQYKKSFNTYAKKVINNDIQFFDSSSIFNPNYDEAQNKKSTLYSEYKTSLGLPDINLACKNMKEKIGLKKREILLNQSKKMIQRTSGNILNDKDDIERGALEYSIMRKFEGFYIKNLLPGGNVIKLSLVSPKNDYLLDGINEDMPTIYGLPMDLQVPWMNQP